MDSPIFFNSFSEKVNKGVFNFTSDLTSNIKAAFCNTLNPPTADNGVLSDLTTIDATNMGDNNIKILSSVQADGVFSLVLRDKTFTTIGIVPSFRYMVFYDDKTANNALICYYDYGSDIILSTSGAMLDYVADALGLFRAYYQCPN